MFAQRNYHIWQQDVMNLLHIDNFIITTLAALGPRITKKLSCKNLCQLTTISKSDTWLAVSIISHARTSLLTKTEFDIRIT